MCWQKQDGGTFTVLRLVFTYFDGGTLSSVRGVCRLWCEAANEDSLWRDLVRTELCRSVAPGEAELRLRSLSADGGVSWYDEYWRIRRSWIPRVKLRDNEQDEGPIESASICGCGSKIAVLWRSGGFTVWRVFTDSQFRRRFEEATIEARVSGIGSGDEGRGGGVQWSADCDRLLVARRLVLSQRWELAVYRRRFSEDDTTTLQLVTRTTCSGGAGRAWGGAGAGGCWAGKGAVLTLQPAIATNRHLLTDVWLNAADQSTCSEKEGVVEPLFRVYNENRAPISHAAVAEVLSHQEEDEPSQFSADTIERATRNALCHSFSPNSETNFNPWFIYTSGSKESAQGHATALAAIRLPPLIYTPVSSDTTLAERVEAAKRKRSAVLEEETEELSEEELRSVCVKPDVYAALPGRVVGMVLHPVTPPHRCAIVTVSSEGASSLCCVSLPQLVLLRVLHSSHLTVSAPLAIHYVQPAGSGYFVGSPAPSDGPLRLWSSLTGAEVRNPPRAPSSAPAVALMLSSDQSSHYALVAAGRALHVWSSGPLEDDDIRDSEESDDDLSDDEDSR